MNNLLTIFSKTISKISKTLNLGNGSTWPGHIALTVNPHIIEDILKHSSTEIILIVGTNGKTTTGKILTTILEETKKKVIQNTSGANLLNGVASTLLTNISSNGKLDADYAVFEVDENNLPFVLEHITPRIIIALNLFRDQLDRYGELDSIAKKWNAALSVISSEQRESKNLPTLILNADDPLIAHIGLSLSSKMSQTSLSSRASKESREISSRHSEPIRQAQGKLREESDSLVITRSAATKQSHTNISYFGLSSAEKGQKELEHGADSIYCPNCGSKLTYKKIFYSHLGIWECPHCGLKRPLPNLSNISSPLPGIYNTYNTLAAVLAAKNLGINQESINRALQHVKPAFGRQEKLTYKGKSVQIFLSKNPVSMNESLRTVMELSNRHPEQSKRPFGEGSTESGESYSSLSKRSASKGPSILFVLNDWIPDGRDVSWIWDIDLESYIDKFKSVYISGDRAWDMGLRFAYASDKPYAISHKLTVEEDLHKVIDQALEQIQPEDTLFILPTYSAMLEVRKILTGKKIL